RRPDPRRTGELLMDANAVRFQLVAGRPDWERFRPGAATQTLGELWSPAGTATTADAAWDPDRSELTLKPKLFRFDKLGAVGGPSLTDRRGAAVDRFGNWFWISSERSAICVNSS